MLTLPLAAFLLTLVAFLAYDFGVQWERCRQLDAADAKQKRVNDLQATWRRKKAARATLRGIERLGRIVAGRLDGGRK